MAQALARTASVILSRDVQGQSRRPDKRAGDKLSPVQMTRRRVRVLSGAGSSRGGEALDYGSCVAPLHGSGTGATDAS